MLTIETPVAKVAVWAISIDSTAAVDPAEDVVAAVQKRGILLGYTDEQGYVSPPPQFRQAGNYRLVAVKEGYKPGNGKIAVSGPVPVIPVPSPRIKPPILQPPAINNEEIKPIIPSNNATPTRPGVKPVANVTAIAGTAE